MSSLNEMLALLVKLLRDPLSRKPTVAEFQSLIWDCRQPPTNEDTFNVLADLAHDLDYFEPDPVLRAQDAAYYGHDGLEKVVKTALSRLADLGVEVRLDLPPPY